MTCIYNKEYILLLVKKQREFFISWDWHFFRSPMKSHLLFVQSPTVWKVKFRKFAKFVNFRQITVATNAKRQSGAISKSVSFCFTCQFWGVTNSSLSSNFPNFSRLSSSMFNAKEANSRLSFLTIFAISRKNWVLKN